MATYLLRRLLATLPVLLLTSIIVFLLMRLLPGDPINMYIGQAQADVSEEMIAQLRRDHGLDQPLPVQYAVWIGKVLAGDLGRSILSPQPVLDILAPRILPTVQISLIAWLLAVAFALPVGIMSATRPDSWADRAGTVGALIGAAMPYFLVGGLLIYFVALEWRLLPASGFVSPFVDPWASLRTSLLPAVTLSFGLAAVIVRQSRSSFIDVLQQAYIKTARAKGLAEDKVILRHAFKNAMLPVVTIMGIQLATLFSGSIVTETIFAVPGVGRLLVSAILGRDYPVVQAVVLFITLVVVFANLAVDLAYGFLDPRTRQG
ncbi:MAG: ABC transporter permease [Alphaproteobacteria bacterium]|nr:ABC transporter permease [Alphaproteobacteria bacterium]